MSQTFLDENPPMILDATCSTPVSTHWPRSATIRMDIRKEVFPDIVGDDRFMPFRTHSIDMIYCDPHHMIVTESGLSNSFYGKKMQVSRWFASVNRNVPNMAFQLRLYNMQRYGNPWKSREEWLDFLSKTNVEFFRVLKPNGELRYKLSEFKGGRSVKLADLDLMSNFQIERQRETTSNSHNPTYWLTMRPKQ